MARSGKLIRHRDAGQMKSFLRGIDAVERQQTDVKRSEKRPAGQISTPVDPSGCWIYADENHAKTAGSRDPVDRRLGHISPKSAKFNSFRGFAPLLKAFIVGDQ
jgi:hypothetical protein